MLSGKLFTRDFLVEGIDATASWTALDETQYQELKERLLGTLKEFLKNKRANEAETEKDFIWPVLGLLGWNDIQVQQTLSAKGRKQVPDALLFADAAARAKALGEHDHWKRYQFGLAVVEAKRWNSPLDRADRKDEVDGVPSTQMLQYLSRVDVQTNGRVRLGILTNGRIWRLYFQGALSVSEDFFEIDLPKALGLEKFELDLIDRTDTRVTPDRALRLFILMFGKQAFLPAHNGLTFHDTSREHGRTWEERVARDLSTVVFERLFPELVAALEKHDPDRPHPLTTAYVEQIRQSALILLYRLLFVVYAEDRDLLPDQHEGYKPYSLTQLRLSIANARQLRQVPSDRMVTYWPKLKAVFTAISEGDDSLGIPPYNGGLFSKQTAPLLERVQIPDRTIADLVFGLSHQEIAGEARYINFRDLSVQQLGSIYERILDYGLALRDDQIAVDENDTARHASGSYYTPDSLVTLVIEKSVAPLVEQKRAEFLARAQALSSDAPPQKQKLAEISSLGIASRILDLKVCDPAMGSGHFLVSLVDWLADRVLAAMAESETAIEWLDEGYQSPLAFEIIRIRTEIIRHADEHKWPIVSDHLEDRHIVRRMILKRCIFGVDKNPMAVELAKVALWLHTFTVGAPLSFLDHHLRCGDSLFGSWVRPAIDRLTEWGSPLLIHEPMKRALGAASGMRMIERLTDADIAEAHQSKQLFDGIESMTASLNGLLSIVDAVEWEGRLSKLDLATVQSWLKGSYGDPVAIATGGLDFEVPPPPQEEESQVHQELQKKRKQIGKKQVFSKHDTAARLKAWLPQLRVQKDKAHFFHWQTAFPGIWDRWENSEPYGGFDAVISNPPYVRQELLTDIKPSLKRTFKDSYDGAADLYVYFYERGMSLLRPGGRLSYVVTNKWMRAGYAERLRGLLSEKSWVEFVADFGHAKQFFPDADVFPSVLVIRKPNDQPPPANTTVCVISRDSLPDAGLTEAVSSASYPLPRIHFTNESWTLESPNVIALLEKIKRNGAPLAEYARVDLFRGVTTGFNKAFLIDTTTRDRLVAEHPSSAEIIKPYVRGQDISRWYSPWADTWMIFTRRGINLEAYPAVAKHLEMFKAELQPKPADWVPTEAEPEWHGRKTGQYQWFEIQDSTEYWREFEKPKIIYQEIAWWQTFQIDRSMRFLPNTAYMINSVDPWLVSVLNSPAMWWLSWRKAIHGKDEALRFIKEYILTVPIPQPSAQQAEQAQEKVGLLEAHTKASFEAENRIRDWLGVEFGMTDLKGALEQPATLTADEFMRAVRSRLPKGHTISAAEVAKLRQEYQSNILPAQEEGRKAQIAERELSAIVNEAFGLSSADNQLMWRTAPPRMPIPSDKLTK